MEDNFYQNTTDLRSSIYEENDVGNHVDQDDDDESVRIRFRFEDRRGTIPIPKEEAPKVPLFDAFTSIPAAATNSDSEACYEISTQIFKLVVYVLTFIFVLISAMIAKGTILFMISQIRPGKTTPYCDSLHSNLQSYEAVLDLQEQAQWIWVLFFAFITPEFFTFLRSVRLITFKSYKTPTFEGFSVVWVFETLHTIGIAILVFVALPELDVVKALMLTNCLCIVPGLLLMLSRNKGGKTKTTKFMFCLAFDAFAIVSQASGLVIWPLLDNQGMRNGVWAIPLGIVLTSLGWWENYVEPNSIFSIIQYLDKQKKALNECRTRYFTYMIISVWKMAIFFSSMVVFVYLTAAQSGQDGLFIFKYFITDNSTRTVVVKPTNASSHIYLNPHLDGTTSDVVKTSADASSFSATVDGTAAISVWGIQIAAAYFCYITCKFACRVQMQGFSFAIPITLTVPTAISLLVVGCGMKNTNVCYMKDIIPRYLFWECPSQEFFNEFIISDYGWIWFFWFISQVWITFHIWVPKNARLASTEKIFLNPMYNAVMIDQSVTLNRRRDDGENISNDENAYQILEEQDDSNEDVESAVDKPDPDNELKQPESADHITMIKACITMWHETPAEMLATLTSLMRLDQDQCFRRLAQKYFSKIDKDYYKLEAHIFVDDAFKYNRENKQWELNDYVKKLLQIMGEAAKKAYEYVDNPKLQPPKKYATPYGGRLVYRLLGGNKLYVHLKDKMKIRHRKRWSQVMYMYYLLGIRLNNLDLDVKRKDIKAENTYLLALDGDIEFKPKAVLLLVDLMKKNLNLGAACGRIHPVGSGIMAWYQMFEYAIGHWLQKATEHIIGCVLCSPGCFSLFRGQALMTNNVMNTYTTRATEARHYVQYDQGEDRWLCTLLLQQGYRVEYAAASDSYTHCPESFGEFYNQRRRWVPSTMANILDLLTSAKRTIKSNDDISIIYIIYQMVLMASSIIGPGTIFMMVLGAMVSAFGIDNYTSMWINIIPVLIFVLTCFLCKQKTQIKVAAILTCVYALLMMAVLVGIFLEIAAEGWLAPSSFFLILTASLMVITALLHPSEMLCILCGVIYWVVIPSMYLLLIVFSAMNMNDVTWGVREDPTANVNQAQAAAAAAEAAAKKGNIGTKTLSALGLSSGNEDDEDYCSINCGNLWKLSCCTHPKSRDEVLEQITKLNEKLENSNKDNKSLEKLISRRLSQFPRPSTIAVLPGSEQLDGPRFNPNTSDEERLESSESDSHSSGEEENAVPEDVIPERDPEVNPYWIDDECLTGPQHSLHPVEVSAWRYIIDKYLLPLTEDDLPEGKKVIERQLKQLRNQTVFTFFMLNTLFVVTLFLMQLHQDVIYIAYPDIGHTNITWNQEDSEVIIEKGELRIEPIGLVFILVFAVIMIIQFVAMLFHRFGTVSLILSTTDITLCTDKSSVQKDGKTYLQNHSIKIMKRLLKQKDNNNEEPEQPERRNRAPGARRNTLFEIEQRSKAITHMSEDIEKKWVRRLTNFAQPDNPDIIGANNWLFKSMPKEAAIAMRRLSHAVLNSEPQAFPEDTDGEDNEGFLNDDEPETLGFSSVVLRNPTAPVDVDEENGGHYESSQNLHGSSEDGFEDYADLNATSQA